MKKRKIKYSAIIFLCWFVLLVLLVDGVLKFQTLVDYFGSYALVEVALLLLVLLPTLAVYAFTKEKKVMANALLYYLIFINVVTFLVYGIDKWKAKQGSWRISEATLLILAVFGGSIGALLGMKVWHHKTMHKKFKYGLPLILLAQIALIYFICNFSHRSYV